MTRQKKRWLWLSLAVAFAIAIVGWVALQPVRQHSPNPLGPLGGPGIAQDVGSLLGQKASVFSLPDPQGTVHSVVPGQGRSIVLVFHMGLH